MFLSRVGEQLLGVFNPNPACMFCCNAKTALVSVQDFCLVSLALPTQLYICSGQALHCLLGGPQRPLLLTLSLPLPPRGQAAEVCCWVWGIGAESQAILCSPNLTQEFPEIRRQLTETWALRHTAKVIRGRKEGRRRKKCEDGHVQEQKELLRR